MPRFIRLALANQDIPVYGDGSQTRTFCFIEDHLDACIKAMEANLIVNDVANIGNGTIVTILELAEIIIRLTKSQSKIVHLPPLEEGDMTRRQPDVSKMNELLGKPFTSLEEGIQIILNNLV